MRLHLALRPRGLSLLELLLVLVVISVIIFTGINRYQIYKRDRELAIIRENVELLFTALNVYYRETCQSGSPPKTQLTLDELDRFYPVKSKLVTLPGVVEKYEVDTAPVEHTNTTYLVFALFVHVYFTNSDLANWYAKALGAVVRVRSNNEFELMISRWPGRITPDVRGAGKGMLVQGLHFFTEQVGRPPLISPKPFCGY